jgi:hypothetical protein
VTTLLVTDAAFDADLPALPGDVRHVPVGDDAANVGIAAFALRRAGDGLSAFVRLRNAGPRRLPPRLAPSTPRRRPRRPSDHRPARRRRSPVTFPGVPVTAWAEARWKRTTPSLWTTAPGWPWATVAAARPCSSHRAIAFLAQALRSLPDLTLTEAAPGAQQVSINQS